MAQEKGIPSCFQKKIAESKDYLGLYLAEIEGDTLYYLETPPLPGADRINVSTFYDEDCNEVNKSATGGITGRPKGYKPYKLIETLWEKEIFPIKSFSQRNKSLNISIATISFRHSNLQTIRHFIFRLKMVCN